MNHCERSRSSTEWCGHTADEIWHVCMLDWHHQHHRDFQFCLGNKVTATTECCSSNRSTTECKLGVLDKLSQGRTRSAGREKS